MYLEQFQKQETCYSRSVLLGIRKKAVKESMTEFCDLSHRRELVAEVNGVYYYDDSRSQNANSTWFSFESISRRVVWIVNGSATADYSVLRKFAAANVGHIICLGDRQPIDKAFGGVVKDIASADSIMSAVRLASQCAVENDAVVYSPACQVNSCEARGNEFQNAVNVL